MSIVALLARDGSERTEESARAPKLPYPYRSIARLPLLPYPLQFLPTSSRALFSFVLFLLFPSILQFQLFLPPSIPILLMRFEVAPLAYHPCVILPFPSAVCTRRATFLPKHTHRSRVTPQTTPHPPFVVPSFIYFTHRRNQQVSHAKYIMRVINELQLCEKSIDSNCAKCKIMNIGKIGKQCEHLGHSKIELLR